MAKTKLGFRLIAVFWLAVSFSCAKVPVEFSLTDEVVLTKEELNSITENIRKKLLAIELDPPEGSPPRIDVEECKQAYAIWLNKQFDSGRIPKKVLEGKDYTESSNNPFRYQCPKIDFAKNYTISTKEVLDTQRKEYVLFNMHSTKEKIINDKCLRSFIDPKNGKMELAHIFLDIEENKLNVTSPSYTVYSSNRPLDHRDIQSRTEKSFIDDGTFMVFAESAQVPKKFTGTTNVIPIEDKEQYKKAVLPLLTLTGSLVAYPNFETFKPETVEDAGVTYYVVPKGNLRAVIRIVFNFHVSLKDALCTYDEFIEKIKKATSNN